MLRDKCQFRVTRRTFSCWLGKGSARMCRLRERTCGNCRWYSHGRGFALPHRGWHVGVWKTDRVGQTALSTRFASSGTSTASTGLPNTKSILANTWLQCSMNRNPGWSKR